MFIEKPAGILKPSMLVIDESFWQAGTWGTDSRSPTLIRRVDLGGIIRVKRDAGRDLFGNKQANAEASATADLEPVREKLRAILAGQEAGPLRRQAMSSSTPAPTANRRSAPRAGARSARAGPRQP